MDQFFLQHRTRRDFKVIEELLCVLVAPGTAASDSLENVFASNIKNVAEKINSSETFRSVEKHLTSADLSTDDGDVLYRFARLNLRLIRLLQTVLDESVAASESVTRDDEQRAEKIPRQTPALPADSLSISQQKTVTTAIGFGMCFGICPYLLPGVGLPLNRRCGFGGCVEMGSSVNRDDMDRRLLWSTVKLLECVSDVSSKVLSELIISRHLGDLLAALFQIRYMVARRGSTLRAAEVAENEEVEERSGSGSESKRDGLSDEGGTCVERMPEHDVDFCRRQLDILLEKLHQPSLIQQLLILQNGPPPTSTMSKVDKMNMAPVPSPVWLRKLARKCLVAAIMRPTGIQSLFAVLIQGENEKSSDWKRYDDIAKIVVDIPLGVSATVENYYEKISPQILELIRMSSNEDSGVNDARVAHRRQCVRAAVQMVALMALRQNQLVERFLMKALLCPLLQCLEKPEDLGDSDDMAGSPQDVVVKESVLTSCIENISTLTISPDDSLVTLFYPVLGVLFPLYLHVQQSVTYLRSKVEDILHWIFRHIDLPTALGFLGQFCVGMTINPNLPLIRRMNEDLGFSSGESGGLSIGTQPRKKPTLDISSCESLAECIVHLIVSSKRQDDIGAELFLLCLKCLSDIISNEVDSSSGKDVFMENLGRRGKDGGGGIFRSSHFDSEAGEASAEVDRIQRNLTVITLLTKMCERFGPSCMNKSTHILGFVEATLTRGVKILENTSDAMFGAFEMETLSMALGLLTSLFADKEKLSGLDWQRMQQLIPLLQALSDSAVDPSLHEMALDLRIAIATHGLVHLGTAPSRTTISSGGKKSENKERKDEGTRTDSSRVPASCTKKSPLIEVLSSTEVSDSPAMNSDPIPFPTGKDAPTYQQVAALVCDSSVPARGYALIAMRRLVEQRDSETLENGESVLEICFLNLVHPDTYIYLAAIQVVVALAGWNPRMVIPRLAERYASGGGGGEAEKGSAEMRMKVGEVLVKVCVGLGDLVPLYRDLLLGSVLSAAKDPDALVRASAMSNLGEICRLLRFGLGNVVHEIFLCVRNLLKYDDSVEVRRGAALFTTLLLRGLSGDMFTVLENLSVESLRLVKDVLKHDKDDCVRLHAQASLEVFEAIMHDFLTPSQTMEKHIRFP